MSPIIPIITLRLATPTTSAITSLTGRPSMARRSSKRSVVRGAFVPLRVRHTVGGRGITDKRLDGSNERSSAPSPERAVAFTLVPTFCMIPGPPRLCMCSDATPARMMGPGQPARTARSATNGSQPSSSGRSSHATAAPGPRSGLTPTARTPASSSVSGAPASRTHSASLRGLAAASGVAPVVVDPMGVFDGLRATGGQVVEPRVRPAAIPQRRGRTCSGSTRRAGREVWCGASSLTPSNPLRRGFG